MKLANLKTTYLVWEIILWPFGNKMSFRDISEMIGSVSKNILIIYLEFGRKIFPYLNSILVK